MRTITSQEQQNYPEQMLDSQLDLALDRGTAPAPHPSAWEGTLHSNLSLNHILNYKGCWVT